MFVECQRVQSSSQPCAWVVTLFSLGERAALQPPPPHPGTRVAGASWVEAGPTLGEGVFLPP